MKVAYSSVYGGPEIIEIKDIPIPQIEDKEVLVKVHKSSVNRTDDGFLKGKPIIVRLFSGLFKPKTKVLGSEFAGEIVETGKLVTEFRVGDRVIGFDDATFGGHAEYLKIREDKGIITIPDSIDYDTAAVILEGAHYSLFYIKDAKIRSGTKVLLNGSTGAIGSAALQIMKYHRADVTATCNTKNLELIRSLGADRIINYEEEDFTQLNEQFHVVFDAVGKSSFKKCKHLIKPGGFYMSTELGPRNENPFLAIWTKFFGDKKVLFPIPNINKEDLEFLRNLVVTGDFKPIIDRHYSLDEIKDAYRYVATGEKTGNVVIDII